MDEILNQLAALHEDVQSLRATIDYLIDALAAESEDRAPITDLDGNAIGCADGDSRTLDDA